MSDDITPSEPTIQQLREAADRGRVTEAENALLRRQLAFAAAGIDFESGVGKLLLASYDGEPTKDAVLSAASEYGITVGGTEPPPATPPPPTPSAETQAAAAAQAALTAEGAAPPPPESDIPSTDQAYEQYRKELGKGAQNSRAAAKVIDRQIAAAIGGDENAIWKGYWSREELGK